METRPTNRQLHPRISDGTHCQAGIIKYEDREGFLVPDGRAIKKTDFPELYAAIGDRYTAPRLIDLPLPWWKRFLRLLGVRVTPEKIPNPAYIPESFNLPNLYGCFIDAEEPPCNE